MITELTDVSEREMSDFLVRFVDNAKNYEGIYLQSAIQAINDTLGDVGVEVRLYHVDEHDNTWAQ